MKTITNITYPSFALFALACFALSPQARAQCPQTCDGDRNTALGEGALSHNEGINNTAVGYDALQLNTSGFGNTALGFATLVTSGRGSYNTAIGDGVLAFNIDGSFNTAVGHAAMNGANVTGSRNIALGSVAGYNVTTGNDNIDIGNQGVADESGVIRIGTEGTQTATYIAGIKGAGLAHGAAVAVGITPDGQLGVRASSARFKEAIRPMDKASEVILALHPVSFRYRRELDAKGVPQFGLIAEEVAKVNPDLVARDKEGKPFTVRYDEVNAMLLNEFLKEHRKVQELEANAARQQKQIEALTAGLQKVSAQLEVSKPIPQIVANNQ
jgi:hypothetical protein